VKTDLQISHLEVTPGQSSRVSIEVINNAEVIDGITAIVDGINPDWIRLERPLISVFPDASDQLELVFDIPATCPAGDYLVIVRIVSTIDDDRQTVHDFWLTVTPAPALGITLTPQIVTGGSTASFVATIANTGNTNAPITVEALEPTRDIDCTVDPTNLLLPQGDIADVEVQLRGKRPWFGDPVVRTIDVSALVDDIRVEARATFRQKARIARGLLTALILMGIVLLWALIFLLVISEIRRTEDPAKAVGAGFMTGPDNIPIARVAATVEGVVTAQTTGQGVPRITVEAQRINREGLLESVASAATDDEGRFSIKSLIPGTYKLRFSADGFVETWYPDAGDASTAEEIRLDPRQTRDDLDIVIAGRNNGVLEGRIAIPPDAVGTELTVTATLVPGGEQVAQVTTTDGSFVLTDLPTPATYNIAVTGPGFQTQQFEQTLGGGQTSVINTLDLTAAAGSISGTVVDGDLRALGGVTVTARSGDLTVTSVTPTAGSVGRFEFIGLSTPQTYSLTFEFPGYDPTTIALALDPGASLTDQNVVLTGGRGTITGTAIRADGSAVGGATVTVLGQDVTSTTTTLTAQGQGGGPGSFTVEGLPVPGNYTVSISAPGFQTETLSALLVGAAPRPLGNVVLLPDTAQVSGTVSASGGGGLGEVRVTLSDGTERTRSTISASNPAGRFSFAGVPPGSYTLTFEAPSGFATRIVLIRVVAGADLNQNVSLSPSP
jgi:hypothetical protein